ncbi:hypothetical protein CWC46_10565 [Prodigiosinella confusarubida]|uniref:Uncharacterized protein n=1 Tax=Serratia sp. (strain ATCC 39006) TaxID=104623 RepID=A0A2I5TIZ9_SERS3|nr:hypothetical protein [Serratia sp. ATCC 39006]AUH00206.1 hypothetical protein CWC46_10565 [Serratia sp. ATCC 39006]AUH04526.1 hypothetical protein Ser39006_010570 [Serratia sp. ATCC 39006]
MTVLPPSQVPGAVASSFPELLMLAPNIQTVISGIIKNSAGLQSFLQLIEQQGAPANTSGWAYTRELAAQPSLYRLDLSPQTCAAIPAFMQPILNQAMDSPDLKNWVWTVQQGRLPGPTPGPSSIPDWELTTLTPQGGVMFPSIKFNGNGNAFSLSLTNQIARHLGVYIEFLSGGSSVVPAGWQSRLPAGVTSAFETTTIKYLGLLLPNTAVAGIEVSPAAQTFNVVLPANADTIRLSFGGIGNGSWQNIQDSAGVFASFIYDYAVPLMLSRAKTGGVDLPSWFQQLLSNQSILADVLNAGQGLLSTTDFPSVTRVLQWLSDNTSELFLGDPLAALREEINKKFGDTTVENSAAYLGWPAQTLLSLLDDLHNPGGGYAIATTSRLLALPPQFSLSLSPSTLVDLLVTIQPDAEYGQWLLQADKMNAEVVYCGGYSQQRQADIPVTDLARPVTLTFGSVINKSQISGLVKVNDSTGNPVSTGIISGQLNTAARQAAWSLPILDTQAGISTATRYDHKCKLVCSEGEFSWQNGAAPTATLANLTANSPLSQLIDITLQQAQSSLGYTWRTTEQGVKDCNSGGVLSNPYYIQNIGVAQAQAGLKMVNCGFVQRPALVYADSPSISGPSSFYLDPRNGSYLRQVDLSQAGNFDLNTHLAVAQFEESNLTGFSLHPDGFAIAVSWANAKLERVLLAEQPVSEQEAPQAQVLSGPGTQPGLLSGPVATAVTPAGFILVLENGSKRVQAFDRYLNPAPIFNDSAYLPLQATSGATYQDIAVAPNGCIYLLLYVGDGASVTDYLLDIYQPDGSFISRTTGVNGARLVVDTQCVVYTLNFEVISGPDNRRQPSISKWLPQE